MLIEEGEPVTLRAGRIELIDRVIAWRRSYGLYVILDLHGAPGSQTGTNIDDSEHDQPELFIQEHNRRMTIELWRILAERYKDEWIVVVYDLLNEQGTSGDFALHEQMCLTLVWNEHEWASCSYWYSRSLRFS